MIAIRKPSLALSVVLLALGLALVAFGPGPLANAAPGDGGCPSQTMVGVQITCTFDSTGFDGVVWSVPDASGTVDQQDATSAQVTFTSTGSHDVRVDYNDPTDLIQPAHFKTFPVQVDPTPPPPNQSPSGSISGIAPNPAFVCTGIKFTASFTDPESDPMGYSWSFDNGAFTTPSPLATRTTSKTKFSPGQHSATVHVTDGHPGNLGFDTQSFTVNDQSPAASFKATPGSPAANEIVTLDASASKDPDSCDAIAYSWDLNGDGVFGDATGKTAQTSFPAAGTNQVQLRVTDKFGASATASADIAVGQAGPAVVTSTPVDNTPAPIQTTTTTQAGTPAINLPTVRRVITPFPIVRVRGRITSRGARITLLTVTAPRGTVVLASCKGKGCPKRKKATQRAVVARRGIVRIRAFERSLRAGARITIYVMQQGRIGKYTRFTILKGKAPTRKDSCVNGRKAARCPTF